MQSKCCSGTLSFSILICSIRPKQIKSWINPNITEESFPCKRSVLLITSYLQSAWFLKQDYVLPRCRLHHLPELPQQHLTSPSHKELWKRSSSSHFNLIPLLVSKAQGHSGTSSALWRGTCLAVHALELFPPTRELGRDWQQESSLSPPQSSMGSLFEAGSFQYMSTGPHSSSPTHWLWDGITGGNHTLEAHSQPVQHSPKGILGSEVSWGRQVTSHLQHWINRISHKLVQLPLKSSVLPTWQQPVLIYSCAGSDTSPPFEAAQGVPGLSAAHSFSEFSRLPLL